jgi:hypothetical protein
MSRLSHPLPVQPDQDGQIECDGDAEHAGPGPQAGCAHSTGVDLGDLRRARHPSAAGDLLGQREPDRAALLLRRGQARRRDADDGLSPPEGGRHADRTNLQHLRSAHGGKRRAGGVELHRPGAERPAADHLRVRRAEPLLLLRRRSGGRPHSPDEHRRSARAGQPGQSGGVHHPRAGRGDRAHLRRAAPDRGLSAAPGRPDPAPAMRSPETLRSWSVGGRTPRPPPGRNAISTDRGMAQPTETSCPAMR